MSVEGVPLPNGRLCLAPEEVFAAKLTQRFDELAVDDHVGRVELFALLETMREALNYAEELPDEPPLTMDDVDECLKELDFEGEGIGIARRSRIRVG